MSRFLGSHFCWHHEGKESNLRNQRSYHHEINNLESLRVDNLEEGHFISSSLSDVSFLSYCEKCSLLSLVSHTHRVQFSPLRSYLINGAWHNSLIFVRFGIKTVFILLDVCYSGIILLSGFGGPIVSLNKNKTIIVERNNHRGIVTSGRTRKPLCSDSREKSFSTEYRGK